MWLRIIKKKNFWRLSSYFASKIYPSCQVASVLVDSINKSLFNSQCTGGRVFPTIFVSCHTASSNTDVAVIDVGKSQAAEDVSYCCSDCHIEKSW